MHRYWVYILASNSRTLYVGVTRDIRRRLQAHRSGETSFTARYRIHRLVYIEGTDDVRSAIRREKQLKGWRRERKIEMITSMNPGWDDLLPASERSPQGADPSLRSG
jgi:putative endonuclease